MISKGKGSAQAQVDPGQGNIPEGEALSKGFGIVDKPSMIPLHN